MVQVLKLKPVARGEGFQRSRNDWLLASLKTRQRVKCDNGEIENRQFAGGQESCGREVKNVNLYLKMAVSWTKIYD